MKKRWFPVIINTLFAAVSLLVYSLSNLENINSLVVVQIVV